MARNVGEFVRPADPRLSDGLKVTATNDQFFNNPAQHIIDPALAAAQFYKYPAFPDTPQVVNLPASYVQSPADVRLYALNYTVHSPNGPLPVLAAFPSNRSDGRIFTVEVRRGGYDAAIGNPGEQPAGLVVHSINPNGRVRYEGVAPLALAGTPTDWHSQAGNSSLRLLNVDAGNEFVDFVVIGGEVWPITPTLNQVFSGGDGIRRLE